MRLGSYGEFCEIAVVRAQRWNRLCVSHKEFNGSFRMPIICSFLFWDDIPRFTILPLRWMNNKQLAIARNGKWPPALHSGVPFVPWIPWAGISGALLVRGQLLFQECGCLVTLAASRRGFRYVSLGRPNMDEIIPRFDGLQIRQVNGFVGGIPRANSSDLNFSGSKRRFCLPKFLKSAGVAGVPKICRLFEHGVFTTRQLYSRNIRTTQFGKIWPNSE